MMMDDELKALRREATRLLQNADPAEFAAVRIEGHVVRSVGAASVSVEAARELGQGAGRALFDLRRGTVSVDGRSWATRFATTFLTEIRGAICGTDPGHNVEGLTARGAASAIAGWVVGALGLSNPIAFGVATLVVLVLGSALHTSFCKMTEPEINASLATV
jgi:hypothetical protein